MTEPIVAESEWVEAATPFEKRRKRITYQCPRCEHVYVRTFAAEPKRDPPCPNRECVAIQRTGELRREVENLRKMLLDQQAPGVIGQNVRVKAADLAAEITMSDNKLTDLRDHIREGEIAAPKLPPRMQQAADGFFAKRSTAVIGQSRARVSPAFLEKMGRRARAGAFSAGAIDPTRVLPRVKPPVNYIA